MTLHFMNRKSILQHHLFINFFSSVMLHHRAVMRLATVIIFFHARMCTREVYIAENEMLVTGFVGTSWSPLLEDRIIEQSIPRSMQTLESTIRPRYKFHACTCPPHCTTVWAASFLSELSNVDVGRQLEFNWRATMIPGMSNEHSWISYVINFAKLHTLRVKTKNSKFQECIPCVLYSIISHSSSVA